MSLRSLVDCISKSFETTRDDTTIGWNKETCGMKVKRRGQDVNDNQAIAISQCPNLTDDSLTNVHHNLIPWQIISANM